MPSLMSIIERGRYQLWLEFIEPVSQAQLDEAIAQFWKREEIIVYRYKRTVRIKKPVNIRPGVYEMALNAQDCHATLEILVQSGNEGKHSARRGGLWFNVYRYASHTEYCANSPAGLVFGGEQGRLVTPLDVV